jgi:membrane protein
MAWTGWLKDRTHPLVRLIKRAVARIATFLDHLSERYRWIAVLDEAVRNFFRHDMTLHAGNFAYSAFLAIFPLVLLITFIIGLVFRYNPDAMHSMVDTLKNAIPEMPTTIGDAAEAMVRFRAVVGVLGLIGLVWTISKIANAIQTGFEQIWETKRRSFVRKKLLSLGIMLLLMVVAIAGLFITFVSSQFLSWIDRHTGPVFSTLALILSALLSPLATALIFSILYRWMPLKKPSWKAIFLGALTASLLLDMVEYALGYYFTRISKTEALYGTLGVAIGVVIWLYFVGIFIFLGAEIVRSLQQRWGESATTGGSSGGVQLQLFRGSGTHPVRDFAGDKDTGVGKDSTPV